MFALKVLVITIIAASSVAQSEGDLNSVIELQNKKLDSILETLHSDFQINTKERFWTHKQQTERMIQAGQDQKAKEYLNAVQLATLVQSLRYAILRKTISATKDIINRRFVQNGQGFVDSSVGVVVLPQMVPVIVARAILRAYADGWRFVEPTWSWLHLVIEHYHQTNPEVRQVAIEAYKQRNKFLGESQAALGEHNIALKAAFDQIGIHEANLGPVVSVVDRIIDEAMGCPQCFARESKYFGVGPMFDGDSAVAAAVGQYVDQDLQDAYTDIDGVYTPGLDAQAKVTPEQVDTLMQKILG